MPPLSELTIKTIRDAATLLSGPKRRRFQAQVTLDYLDGSARQAEYVFGWGRHTVQLGLHELRTGLTCVDRFTARGRHTTEEDRPQLAQDIRDLVEPHTQGDPTAPAPFAFTRITAKAVRTALIERTGYRDEDLPSQRTLSEILNRLGYRLRHVQKTRPRKKIKQTDAIFANVDAAHARAATAEDTLRISIDTKAKVQVGEFSRDGEARGAEAVEALDHDMDPVATLIPFGILEVLSGVLTILFGTTRLTSDFVVDCLERWWQVRRTSCPQVKRLMIDLDNGPETSSRRTQFIKRMVEFADKFGVVIELVYYPPYHSKYNPIERCWGILEQHWNGALLSGVEVVLNWAKTMTWKGEQPTVHLVEGEYARGIRLGEEEMKPYEARLERSATLPKWSVIISPQETAVR
jgi:Rhodopirellula transposase DDE domain